MIKLIAIGNRIMKDDGVAITVTEHLKNRLERLGVEIIIGETNYQSCFEQLEKDDFVIILDAVYLDEEPGSIHLFKLKNVLQSSANYIAQHEKNLIDLMKLHRYNNSGYLIGIEAAKVSFGTELSALLKDKFHIICYEIETAIRTILIEELEYA